jgi:oligopeptide transport system permease protein
VGRYVLRRLLWMPLVLFVLLTLSFFLVRLAPGDPFASERAVAPAVHQKMKERYHLDQPLVVQYGYYLADVVRLDLGESMKSPDKTVNGIIAEGIGRTMLLGAMATVLAVALGMTAGVIGAVRQNSAFDYGSMAVATFGMSIPAFVTGPLLVLLFAMTWSVLPVSGFATEMVWWPVFVVVGLYAAWRTAEWSRTGRAAITRGREFAAFWLAALVTSTTIVATLLVKNAQLVMPAVVLALPFASRIARLTRAGMLEVINQDFVRTARAKGLAERVVVLRHALKGGLLPVVSYMGPAISGILTGSLVVERIFAIPGIGREFVESALSRDYTVVLGIALLDGALLMVMNLIVDVVYGFLDPRIRYDA